MEAAENSDDKDSGPEVQINIPNSVLSRIEELMGGTEQFDNADFDAVAYINRMFPTEQSLSGVEAATAKCQYRLAAVHEDIRRMVRSQPEQRCEGQKALLDAQETIGELAVQVADINKKAERSASMVREITAEIKQLDCAKTNLTVAITTLNHAHMLAGALRSLRAMADGRQYEDIVAPQQACMEVLQQLEVYKGVPELGALRAQLMELRDSLGRQILNDFKDAFTGGGKSGISHKTLSDACLLVDVLDPRVKEELLDWIVHLELQEYIHLFSREQQSAWLDHVDARYSWLKKHLLAFEAARGQLLPVSWPASERIAARHCEITRSELSAILASRASEVDVKLLLYAMQKTRAFEILLHRRFVGTDFPEGGDLEVEQEKEPDDQNKQHRWVGSISRCFEPYLHLYIDSLDAALHSLMQTFIQDAQTPVSLDEISAGAGSVLASCAELFMFYKKCVVQCSSLSASSLPKLAEVFAKYLREYSARVLSAQLPSHAALTPVAYISTMLRDEHKQRLSKEDIWRTCRVLCTADYCAATAGTLHDKLQQKMRQPLHTLLAEQEQLQSLTTSCIELLVSDLLSHTRSSSPQSLQVILNSYIPWLRRNLASNRKYLTQFCVRFVDVLMAERREVTDPLRLKQVLLDLPNAGAAPEEVRPPPQAYVKMVLRLMAQTQPPAHPRPRLA